MRIIIVGCGKVGFSLAEQLVSERHDIIIVDNDPDVILNVGNELDVFCVLGEAASRETLTEAGVERAELLIAVTESDETNLLSCLIAKKLGVQHTIARVRNPIYANDINLIKEDMGLSMYINPELYAAREIARILRRPSATRVETFAKGRVELFTCAIRAGSALDGVLLKDVQSVTKCRVLICGVHRDTQTVIPTGSFRLQAGDEITFVTSYRDSAAFFRRIDETGVKIKSVVINGGGRLTYYLAKIVLEMGVAVKIVEVSHERCLELDELLPEATIIHGDATDTVLLQEEGVGDADAVINLTGIDEQNVLLSQYVSEKYPSCKVVTKIKHSDFVDIFSHMKVGSLINPKDLTSDNIIRYVRAMQNSQSADIVALHHIMDGAAESLEFRVAPNQDFLGQPLEQLRFKKNVLIASISRNGSIFIPGGKDTIEAGDNVVAVTLQSGISSIQDLFETTRTRA